MALETGQFINQLVITNPDGLDPKNQGDDHLRLLKRVLKNTFSKITGEVTATHTQLNQLATPGVVAFPGMIVAWVPPTGVTAVPEGWKLCNGENGTPNLIARFPRGATTAGGIGGSADHTHSVNVTVAGHALTVDQIPPHDHATHAAPWTFRGGIQDSTTVVWDGSENTRSGSAGGGQPHTHGASGSTSAVSNLPPYVDVLYIMKV